MLFVQLERHRRVDRHGFQLDVGEGIAARPVVVVIQLGPVRHEHADAGAPAVVDLLAVVQRRRGHHARREVVLRRLAARRRAGEAGRTAVLEARVRHDGGDAADDLAAVQARQAGGVGEDGRCVGGFGAVGFGGALRGHALGTEAVARGGGVQRRGAQGQGNDQGQVFGLHGVSLLLTADPPLGPNMAEVGGRRSIPDSYARRISMSDMRVCQLP
jgi:hypothetical protein